MEKKFLKNMMYISSASILSVITGLISGLVIPKFLDIDNYAYYKLFSFYCGYVGLLHLGFADGVFIKFGKYDYDELPKEKFRGFFSFLLAMQIGLSVLLCTILLFLNVEMDRLIVIGLVIFNITLINCNNYFTFINQFTKRFKLDSKIKAFQSISFICSILGLIILKCNQYIYFICFQTIVYGITLSKQIISNKEIVFGSREKIVFLKYDIKECIIIGFFIMISQLMGEVILGIDRIFVDKYMPLSEFARYSFAISLLGIIYTVISALSKIIYPYLARTPKDKLSILYIRLNVVIQMVTSLILVAYFFMIPIIKCFLPNYTSSLVIVAILFPTIIYKCQINFIGGNYYKLCGFEKEYIINNVVAFLFAFISASIAYFIFKSTVSISFASLLTFIFWEGYTNRFFEKNIGLDKKSNRKNILFGLIVSLIFLIASNYNFIGGGMYILLTLGVDMLFYFDEIKQIREEKLNYFRIR